MSTGVGALIDRAIVDSFQPLMKLDLKKSKKK